jgi:tetratricopeptide (TPR) repeat protein
MFALLLSASAVRAQPAEPYALDAVILYSDHRFLATEAFRQQFPRNFANQVQLALGPLVRVETKSHPSADTLRRDGLGAALDGWNAVTDRRTCFLRLRYENGEFVVEFRYVDGYTGLPSPRVVSARTGDRDRLASLAAGLVTESFALVGDVVSSTNDRAELRLLGGGGEVRPGDVFAVSRIVVQEGRKLGQRLEWFVLEVEKSSQGGVVQCRIHRRFKEDKLDVAADTYRALRLPVGAHPLELRLVEPRTREPVSGVQATIRAEGGEVVTAVSDAQGLLRSKGPLNRLAIVTLRSAGKDVAKFPVPLVGDRPICPVRIGTEGEQETALELRRELWSDRIVRDLGLVDQRGNELQIELGKSLEDARKYAQQTIALIDAELKDLRAERNELDRIAAGSTKRGDADLARLAAERTRLEASIRGLDQAIVERAAAEQRVKEAIALVQRARLLENQARFDEALVLYDQALAKAPELAKKEKPHVDALRADWAIRGEAHEQARKFLVETWPRLSVEEIPTRLVLAEKALETCRKVGDKLTPLRFVAASGEHLPKILAVRDSLKRSSSPDAPAQLSAWTETIKTLGRLVTESEAASRPAGS